MLRLYLIILFIFLRFFCFAQNNKEQFLIESVSKAQTDWEKITALNNLAEYYYVFKLDKKADSVLKSELLIAEISNNQELIFQVLFSDVITNIGAWTSTENFQRTLNFLEKGLTYARESGRQNYQAIAHIRKANLFRKVKEFDKALEQATLAFSALGNNKLDSLKSSLYLVLGDIFLDKGDPVSAYRNYNNAYDLAYTIKNIPLQSEAFHRFASLYNSMGNKDIAKENLFKSLQLNKENNNEFGRLKDFVNLAKLTNEKEYIIKAGALADSLDSDYYVLVSKRIMLAYLMVIDKNRQAALKYLNDNPDLKTSYLNQGNSTYLWTVGNIHKYSNNPDSAIYYFKLAEPDFRNTFNKANLQAIYNDMAECYLNTKSFDTAIVLFEKSFAFSKELGLINKNSSITAQLSKLYAEKADFKAAYDFAQLHFYYQDSLQEIGTQRDVTLLEMEREKRKHEKDVQEMANAQLYKRNLQYMLISIVIVGIFFFMILLGAFPTSRFTIKLLGYFSFICLFEFIVLLLDTYLHRITHGEPLKIWLAKIFLIAILVPFQHFLEHAMIRFIQSKKLMRLRNHLSIKKWWANLKKPTPKSEIGIEEDTAVL